MSIFTKKNMSQKFLIEKDLKFQNLNCTVCETFWVLLLLKEADSALFHFSCRLPSIESSVDPIINISYDKDFSKTFLTACHTGVHIALKHSYIRVKTAVSFAWTQKSFFSICILKLLTNRLFQQQSRL